jgi:DNA-binding transcriptional ArsR family regulator
MNDRGDRFQALADPTRRAILSLLKAGSKSAGEISAEFPLSKPTLSHHFAVLEAAGLVRSERRGNFVVYALQASVIEEMAAALLDLSASLGKRRSRRESES